MNDEGIKTLLAAFDTTLTNIEGVGCVRSEKEDENSAAISFSDEMKRSFNGMSIRARSYLVALQFATRLK